MRRLAAVRGRHGSLGPHQPCAKMNRRQTLQAAVGVTQRIGNAAMTRILQNAVNELNQSGTISVGTRKTVALGGRTKTVKTGATVPLEGVPSDEEIRKMTGA